jgi:hypothetical protein
MQFFLSLGTGLTLAQVETRSRRTGLNSGSMLFDPFFEDALTVLTRMIQQFIAVQHDPFAGALAIALMKAVRGSWITHEQSPPQKTPQHLTALDAVACSSFSRDLT